MGGHPPLKLGFAENPPNSLFPSHGSKIRGGGRYPFAVPKKICAELPFLCLIFLTAALSSPCFILPRRRKARLPPNPLSPPTDQRSEGARDGGQEPRKKAPKKAPKLRGDGGGSRGWIGGRPGFPENELVEFFGVHGQGNPLEKKTCHVAYPITAFFLPSPLGEGGPRTVDEARASTFSVGFSSKKVHAGHEIRFAHELSYDMNCAYAHELSPMATLSLISHFVTASPKGEACFCLPLWGKGDRVGVPRKRGTSFWGFACCGG